MGNETPMIRDTPNGISKLSKDELIEYLKKEVRRVKQQRNEYEIELRNAHRRITQLAAENKNYENYINRVKK